MKEVIICVGISGSGKSTWSQKLVQNGTNYLRINRDDIRKTLVGTLNGYYERKDLYRIEIMVNEIEDNFFLNIDTNYNVVIDNTNLKQSYINRWLNKINSENYDNSIFNSFQIDFKFKLFDILLIDAKDNVAVRDHLTRIQTNYIDKQYEDYQKIKEWILKTHPDKIIL